MKKNLITLTLIALVIISVISLAVSLTFLAVIQEVKTLSMQLEVANRLGFNVDTDKIYFGAIPPGNSGERSVIIENKEYQKSVVRIKVYGGLKEWVAVSENSFTLKKGESKLVKVKVTIPENAELKDYESKMIIMFARI